ncbi:MAG: MTH1187 family thiamine-binding protein [Alkalispirochaeta sp.]
MLVELQIVPVGAGSHIADAVAKAVEVIKKSGLSYQLTPSGTVVEGSWDEVMPVIKEAHDITRSAHSHVITTLRIEDDAQAKSQLMENVEHVSGKLAQNASGASSEEKVQEASEESFPASDPPGYRGVG